MRILVSGGAGFIGSTVVDAYITAGHTVCAYDNLSKGRREYVSHRAEFIEGDILDQARLQSAIQSFKPDVINHHAAHVHVPTAIAKPDEDAQVNVLGTIRLMQAAIGQGVKRIIFASSGAAIYGESKKAPDENAQAKPLSPYGVAKLSAELYLQTLGAIHGIEIVCLRYSNVYGPRQNHEGEGGVVAIFCVHLLNGIPCTIYGDGKQTRDFVYVGDVANANLVALSGPPGCFNIATGKASPIIQVFRILKKEAKAKQKPHHTPARAGEVQHSVLKVTKAQQILGWQAQVELKTGITHTLNSYRRQALISSIERLSDITELDPQNNIASN